jgi:hypothetical protein
MTYRLWLVAVALAALVVPRAAPVPKTKPREGVILVQTGSSDAPPRLFREDGTVLGELPFKKVWNCALSPDGTRIAVIVCTNDPIKCELYVVRVGAGADTVGEPLATVATSSLIAWNGHQKLCVNTFRDPLEGERGYIRSEAVTVHDLERGTATEDKALRGYTVCEASPDGTRLVAYRLVTEPAERWETVLLDAATGKLVNGDIGELNCPRFVGSDAIIGYRTKKGAPDKHEHFVYDFTAKRATPLKFPKELTTDTARVDRVLPSPDAKRLLYFWDEEVPFAFGGAQGTLWAPRMTICDSDGGNARTIYKPDVKTFKTFQDIDRNRFGVNLDWR